MSRRHSDGMMLVLYTPSDPKFDYFLLTLNVPIVVVDRDTPAWADAVMADHHYSTQIMTDHLLTLGHRRIAILTGRDDMFPARERLRGYRAAHEAHGVAIDPLLMRTGSFLADTGFSATSQLLGARDRPTAVNAGGIHWL